MAQLRGRPRRRRLARTSTRSGGRGRGADNLQLRFVCTYIFGLPRTEVGLCLNATGVATWEEWLANVDLPGREKPSKQPSFPPHAYMANDKAMSIFGKEFKELPEIARDVVEDYKLRGWLKYVKN